MGVQPEQGPILRGAAPNPDRGLESRAQLDPLWEELFPAEQARIVRLLVERVEVGPEGADIRLRVGGLTKPDAGAAWSG